MNDLIQQVLQEYQPRFPQGYNPGVAIVGCGKIVQTQHLPAYRKYGVNVIGVYDLVPEIARQVQNSFGIPKVYGSFEEVLEDQRVEVVDIATHPDVRFALGMKAIEAGKHLLVQKPLALTVDEAKRLIEAADKRNVRLAVNQNGRWAPPWRVATLLVEKGYIGEIVAITHLFETSFKWTLGTKYEEIPQWVLYDYAVQNPVEWVRAELYRLPIQPPESKTPWGALVEIRWKTGQTAIIRSIGGANVTRRSHPFWIHGSEGTLRGMVLDREALELEKNNTVTQFHLQGSWYPDGFGGTLSELFSAIVEKREPYHSAKHNLLSLKLTLAARESAVMGAQKMYITD
ncbi:MAG: Gfo/Idh/MocA family oxidoreductase [Spirochaetales bacterium]